MPGGLYLGIGDKPRLEKSSTTVIIVKYQISPFALRNKLHQVLAILTDVTNWIIPR